MIEHSFRLFVSSPGDVAAERLRLHDAVAALAHDMPAIHWDVVRWEDSYYTADSTFQAQIPRPSDCDIVVCIFWKRLGVELPPAFNRPDGSARTGTEFEFEEAVEAAAQRDPKRPDVLVYKKTAPVLFEEEHVDQQRAEKRALDAFWRRWFTDEKGHFTAGFNVFTDVDDFARVLERDLRTWLARQTKGTRWSITTQGSPYRGLKAFDASHAEVFFGRALEVERARARLVLARQSGCGFLLITGASGSGKSSLVRAGLLPRLSTAGGLPGVERATELAFTPRELGPTPIVRFCELLLERTTLTEWMAAGDFGQADALAGLLRRSPAEGVRVIENALQRWATSLRKSGVFLEAPDTALVIVIDQLEEVLRFDENERDALCDIVKACAQSKRIAVIATLRSDSYGHLEDTPALNELKSRGRILDLAPPSAASFGEIVRGPAVAAGLGFERTAERDLATEVEQEASAPGALPMIEFLLEELYERRDDRLLRLADYDALGGAAGALAKAGDLAIEQLSDAARAALPEVLRELMTFLPGEARPSIRAVHRNVFAENRPADECLNALVAARLVVTESDHVRLAHERLLAPGVWPRASRVVNENRRLIEIRDRLMPAAERWAKAERRRERRGLLLTGLPLREGRDLAAGWRLQAPLAPFIKASSLRASAIRAAAINAVVIALALLAFFNWRSAQNARAAHEARLESDRTAYASLVNLAASAYANAAGRESLQMLHRALRLEKEDASPGFEWKYQYARLTDVDRRVLLKPNGLNVISVAPGFTVCAYAAVYGRRPAEDNQVTICRGPTFEPVKRIAAHADGVSALSLSEDGKLLLTGGLNDGMVSLWDVATGRQVWSVRPSEGTRPARVHQVAFLPGKRLVAAYVEPLNARSDATYSTLIYFTHFLALLDVETGKLQESRPNSPTEFDAPREQALLSVDPRVFVVSPSGSLLAVARGGQVWLFDPKNTARPQHAVSVQDNITAMAFIGDELLVAAGNEGHVIDTKTGQRLRGLRNSTLPMSAVIAAPKADWAGDGEVQPVVLASRDGSLSMFDPVAGALIGYSRLGSGSIVAAEGTGTPTVAIIDGDGWLNRFELDSLVHRPMARGYDMALSPDGRTALIWDSAGGRRRIVGSEVAPVLVDIKLRAPIASLEHSDSMTETFVFTADGSGLLRGNRTEVTLTALDEIVRGGPARYAKHGRLVAVSGDRRRAVLIPGPAAETSEKDPTSIVVEVFDVSTGATIVRTTLAGRHFALTSAALSEDGQSLALRQAVDGTVDGDRIRILRCEKECIEEHSVPLPRSFANENMAFLDDEVLAFSREHGIAFRTRRPNGSWENEPSAIDVDDEPVMVTPVSPSGGVVGTRRGAAYVLTPRDSAVDLRRIGGHRAPVTGVWVDRAAQRIVSGDAEGYVKVWNTRHDMELFGTRIAERPIGHVRLLSNGTGLLASTFDEAGRETFLLAAEIDVPDRATALPAAGDDLNTSGPVARLVRIRRELVQGDFERARTALAAAVRNGEVSSATADADVRRARMARAYAIVDAAERAQEQFARSRFTDTGAANAALGELHRIRAMYLDAEKWNRHAARSMWPVTASLSSVYYGMRDFANAERFLREDLPRAPHVGSLANNLGFVKLALGQVVEAANAFNIAIQREPELADAHAGLALAKSRLGDMTFARSAAARAKELDERYEDENFLVERAGFSPQDAREFLRLLQ